MNQSDVDAELLHAQKTWMVNSTMAANNMFANENLLAEFDCVDLELGEPAQETHITWSVVFVSL